MRGIRTPLSELRPRAPGDRIEVDQGGTISSLPNEITDEVYRAELGVGHIETGGVAEEIKDAAVLDRPSHRTPDGFEKPVVSRAE